MALALVDPVLFFAMQHYRYSCTSTRTSTSTSTSTSKVSFPKQRSRRVLISVHMQAGVCAACLSI